MYTRAVDHATMMNQLGVQGGTYQELRPFHPDSQPVFPNIVDQLSRVERFDYDPIAAYVCAVLSATEFQMTTGATVFVVDDNVGMRKSLRALIESAGLAVETYASGEEFLDAYDPGRPGCLVLDVRLRQGSGLDLQDELRRRKAMLPIVILTGHGNVPTSVRALKAGAIDFLQKPVPPNVLLERVRAAIEADRQAREVATERTAGAERLAHLTPRERQVMELLVAGKTSKEIATAMRVSVRTVEGHRRMVLSKTNVSSAAQLVRLVLNARGADRRG
jgi:two-component system response regulator FixJ